MNEIELTQELVRIDSQNPPGNEKEIAKFIHDYLQDLKIQSELIEIEPNRFDVTAEIGRGEGLMFNGHTDTVPIGDANKWKHDPLEGKIVDGRLYGRGSSDMKGGVACILAAVERLHKEDFRKRLVLTFVADEEVLLKGSTYLIKNRKDFLSGTKYGIFAECTSLKAIYAQKGLFVAKARFFGKAVHGSTPDLGVNAIEKAVRFIDTVQKLKIELKKLKDRDLGSGTINIGKISGGTKVNVVPDYCEIEVERRLVPSETPKLALGQFKKALKKSGVDGRIEMLLGRFPMKMDKSSELIESIQKFSKTKLISSPAYMESELFKTGAGIGCVAIGPGPFDQAHVVDEFVPVTNLKKATNLYENLIRKWCL